MPERWLFAGAKQRANRSGIPFTITIGDVVVPSVCPVLGIPLVVSANGTPTDNSPSLDRFENSRGYVPGNVRVISMRANRIKYDATVAELRLVLAYAEGRPAFAA